jgi:hypothetical protein
MARPHHSGSLMGKSANVGILKKTEKANVHKSEMKTKKKIIIEKNDRTLLPL